MDSYISQLLHYHDCVIVPGLGGFVVNYKDAQIIDNQNMFLPPTKEVRFNRSLSHNDGLLANYVMQKESLSYNEALIKIDQFTAHIHTHILLGKEVQMQDVGSFKADAIGNLLFSPSENNPFLIDAFGLTSFRVEPLDNKRIVKLSKAKPAISHHKSKVKISNWNIAAAMILGFFFLATYNVENPTISQASFIKFISSKNIEYSVAQSNEQTNQVYTKVVKNEESINKDFHIIAASLKTYASANSIKEEFISEGFKDAKIFSDNKGHFRVSINSFETREIAMERMKDYRKASRFESVWVLKQ